MKKLIPFYITTIAPYLLLLEYWGVFILGKYDFMNQSIFNGSIAFMLLFYLSSVVIAIITLTASLKKKWDADKILFANMLVKLIQIPAYIMIFVMGVCSLITIFTIPFAIVYWMLDCISVFSTGLVAMSGSIRAKQEGKFSVAFTVITSILSYIFCIDVIVAVVMYVKYKKAQKI